MPRRKNKKRALKFFSIVFIGFILIGLTYWPKIELRLLSYLDKNQQSTEKPQAITLEQIKKRAENISSNPLDVPDELNLEVPFTSQAPFANWDERHEEYCEEASVLMVARFFEGKIIKGKSDADDSMKELDAWQVKNFGFFESTTAQETIEMAKSNFPFLSLELKDFDLVQVKEQLAKGNLIIIPVAGRELGNPNFTPPGPIYHMLVIKGYTKNGLIITNDPGTRNGADYVYQPEVLTEAVADYNHQTKSFDKSNKVMIVVSRAQ